MFFYPMSEPEKKEESIDKAPLYTSRDVVFVMQEITLHMKIYTRAWIGLGYGRVLILKDDVKGLSTYYAYEEGVFTFYDHRGGCQKIHIEEITEIEGL
jgi:hypothetical protein